MRGHENRQDPRIGRHPTVELAHGRRLLVAFGVVQNAATPQGVVGDQQAARPQEPQCPLEVVGHRLLVGVEENGIELLAIEARQNVQRSSDADFDAVRQPRSLHVSAREFGVTLFDLDREELTVVRKDARHPDRRIAAQRSHLEHAPRSDGHEQNL